MFNLLLNWLNMNDMKNTMLNVFIGGGIGVELMELSFDIGLFNEWMRGALMTLSVLAIIWKFYRQGLFKKDNANKPK